MSVISDYISELNNKNKKALSVFLTAGYPDKKSFPDFALKVLDSGADMLEIGVPFSDPLADGPVIQRSSYSALEAGVNMDTVFDYVKRIREETVKPLILMGYANPVIAYGKDKFTKQCSETGVNGVIIPDVPLEEYEDFFTDEFNGLDAILLTTPVSGEDKIKLIDERCSGFLYCVSVTGTTGERKGFEDSVVSNIEKTYSLIKKNKMLIGFGISSPEDIKKFSHCSDGFIVGSAVIRKILNDNGGTEGAVELVKKLASTAHDSR